MQGLTLRFLKGYRYLLRHQSHLHSVKLCRIAISNQQQQRNISQRTTVASLSTSTQDDEISSWPRKVFSGIQPTGAVHLGNYLGAVRKWVELQETHEDVTICIVDMHSITLPQNPPLLRENIFRMAASLIACGIDPTQTTLFIQSAVVEHSELNWILNCLTTMPRLAQLPQFKEKSRMVREVPLGLYVYPVLQAADIMLYKATHVPVGADQVQHIQLAQHLARTFNYRYGEMFPVCHAMIDKHEASRIRSLRDPSRKMSKSDGNAKATINVCDEPDVIVEKIKKALTDFQSDVSYDPKIRPGVSNLVNIHSLITGTPIKDVVEEAKTIDTGVYKQRVSEAIIEHLRPIREQINMHMSRRNELIYMLDIGAEKARQQAQLTMNEVKQRLGLGCYLNMPMSANLPETVMEQRAAIPTASQRAQRMPKPSPTVTAQRDGGGSGGSKSNLSGFKNVSYYAASDEFGRSNSSNMGEFFEQPVGGRREPLMKISTSNHKPVVPTQKPRVEKVRRQTEKLEPFKMDDLTQTLTIRRQQQQQQQQQVQHGSSFSYGHVRKQGSNKLTGTTLIKRSHKVSGSSSKTHSSIHSGSSSSISKTHGTINSGSSNKTHGTGSSIGSSSTSSNISTTNVSQGAISSIANSKDSCDSSPKPSRAYNSISNSNDSSSNISQEKKNSSDDDEDTANQSNDDDDNDGTLKKVKI